MFDNIFKNKNQGIYIAEIGLNHNGDVKTAFNMIRAAAESGADAVKFQTFIPENMNSVYTSSLLKAGVEIVPDTSQLDFFKQFVLSYEDYLKLKIFSEEQGLVFLSSPFDCESVEMLNELGVSLYKIASSELTNIPLIEKVAKTGKPAILSTGISTEEEVFMTIDAFKGSSDAELVLLHCVSLYPLDPVQANLKRIKSLKKRFGLETGFSDHTSGSDTSVLAAAFGARIFEKHFKLSNDHDCPDAAVSLSPENFSEMISSVENAIDMIGDGGISYGDNELPTARAARRSLFARKDIPAGKILESQDIIALRPGIGIPVYELPLIIGKKTRVDIKSGSIIKTEEIFDED